VDQQSQACYKTLLYTTKSNQDVMWQATLSMRSATQSPMGFEKTIVPKSRNIDILYNPRDPRDFRYASPMALWTTPIVILSVGIVLSSLGLMLAMGVPLAERCARVIGFTASLAGRGTKATSPFSQESIYADGHG
jgi:hypothetical protein